MWQQVPKPEILNILGTNIPPICFIQCAHTHFHFETIYWQGLPPPALSLQSPRWSQARCANAAAQGRLPGGGDKFGLWRMGKTLTNDEDPQIILPL